MRGKILFAAAAASMLALAMTGPATAKTVVATTANAGGTVWMTLGDTLVVKLPGRWKLAGDATPELVLQDTDSSGHGARGHTQLTFSAEDTGSVSVSVQNAITGAKLSMLVDVMQGQ